MSKNNNYFIKYDEKIGKHLQDNKCTLILCNLIGKYINFPYKDLKEHKNFKYHFHFNQTDILNEISGFEIHTFMRKIKKLKELGYIGYKNSYSPSCVLRRTTLWYLDFERIKADFGIDLLGTQNVTDSEAPKAHEVPVKGIKNVIDTKVPDHTAKQKEDGESTPEKHTNTNISISDLNIFRNSLKPYPKGIFNTILRYDNDNEVKNVLKREEDNISPDLLMQFYSTWKNKKQYTI
jgi:hypothetical protein